MPIAKKKDIPQDFLEQMKANLKKDDSLVSAETPSLAMHNSQPNQQAPMTDSNTTQSMKKEKYADVMNVRLSPGRRNEIKTFCSSCGISITQYIESSFEYLSKEVAAGRIAISKGGITNLSL